MDLCSCKLVCVSNSLQTLMADLVGPRLYSCCNCRNHVAFHDDVISKAFQVNNLVLSFLKRVKNLVLNDLLRLNIWTVGISWLKLNGNYVL